MGKCMFYDVEIIFVKKYNQIVNYRFLFVGIFDLEKIRLNKDVFNE